MPPQFTTFDLVGQFHTVGYRGLRRHCVRNSALMPEPTAEQHAEQHGRSLRLAAILTAVAGAAHAILFVLSFWLVSDIPRSSASDQAIIDYYDSGSQRLVSIVGLYVMPFSAIAFMWFTVSLRAWAAGVQRRENILLANMQLVSGIVYITLVLIGSAAISVTATAAQFTDGPIDPDLARLFPGYGRTVIAVLGLRIAAVFVVTTSNIGRSAGILPKWFVYAGFVIAIFMLLSASLTRFLMLVFPLWLLLLSTILLIEALRISPIATLGDTDTALPGSDA